MTQQKATQEFIPIKEIRDGAVALKDGSLRMILMASTLNFALKSEDEQNAIVMQYQNFLNSLDFPVQFFIESRKLEIGVYIKMLEDAREEQVNELLKIQTKEYIEFIKNFVKTTNTVSKTFYVVITYSPAILTSKTNPLTAIAKLFGKNKSGGEKRDLKFEEARLQLQQRTDVVRQGLASAGIRTVPLNTEELIELYYKLFNPGEAERSGSAKNEPSGTGITR